MHKIKIADKTLYASDGALLSEVLMKNAKEVEHPCGGRGTCRKCRVLVNGKEELSCRYVIREDITVKPCNEGKIYSVTDAAEAGVTGENLCFVLDIGTTTLALALLDTDTGKAVRTLTAANPQRTYGADVMTRIEYCQRTSVNELTEVLIRKINKMTAQFSVTDIEKMYVAGNTTMLHILFGTDPSAMGAAPYTPFFLESRTESAEKMGIKGVKTVTSLPGVSAFVGADIVAGINYVGMPEKARYSLLVDLGTNAEIALFSNERVLCTAAAAGPCFEGANITCGMSSTEGALCAFSLDESGTPQFETVAGGEIRGICATGLIDMIASLLAAGIIDGSGYMECKSFRITDKVFLCQSDVRQFQLAKSAICSAIVSLINISGIPFDEIDKVYISGGFSSKMNVENAVKTGLLPCELKNKCMAINNSSLLGTVKYASEKSDLSRIIKNAAYVDLSQNSQFCELFISNMDFET